MYSKKLLAFLAVAGRIVWMGSPEVSVLVHVMTERLPTMKDLYTFLLPTYTQEGLASHRECHHDLTTTPPSTRCTCTLELDDMDDGEIYDMMKAPLRRFLNIVPGKKRYIYITRLMGYVSVSTDSYLLLSHVSHT